MISVLKPASVSNMATITPVIKPALQIGSKKTEGKEEKKIIFQLFFPLSRAFLEVPLSNIHLYFIGPNLVYGNYMQGKLGDVVSLLGVVSPCITVAHY